MHTQFFLMKKESSCVCDNFMEEFELDIYVCEKII